MWLMKTLNAALVDNKDAYDQIEYDEIVTSSHNEDATETDDFQRNNGNLYTGSFSVMVNSIRHQ